MCNAFFLIFFLENMNEGAKWQFFWGKTIAFNPAQIDFFWSFVALKILHLKYEICPAPDKTRYFVENARKAHTRFLDPSPIYASAPTCDLFYPLVGDLIGSTIN